MGAGIRDRRILCYFKNSGVEVAVLIDNCPQKQGTEIDGVRVYRKDAFCEQAQDAVIIVSPESSKELEAQLRKEYYHVIGEKEAEIFSCLPESAGYEKLFALGHFTACIRTLKGCRIKKMFIMI